MSVSLKKDRVEKTKRVSISMEILKALLRLVFEWPRTVSAIKGIPDAAKKAYRITKVTLCRYRGPENRIVGGYSWRDRKMWVEFVLCFTVYLPFMVVVALGLAGKWPEMMQALGW